LKCLTKEKPTKQILFVVTAKQYKEFDDEAKKSGYSKAYILRHLMDNFLESVKKKNKDKN